MPRRVAFTDGDDPRIRAAIDDLVAHGLRVTVVGERLDRTGAHVEYLTPLAIAEMRGPQLASTIAARRGQEPWLVERLLARPVPAALALLATREVDAVIVGANDHTRDVLLACELVLDVARDGSLPSSAFVLEVPVIGRPPRRFVCADCAVNPAPTAEQLAHIAVQAAESAHALIGEPPRVALLSFSTHGSATHPDVEKVARATALARTLRPAIAFDGELQADAAIDATVAGKKLNAGEVSEVAGHANVLVFPDLGAANIAYKLVRALADAHAYGAFLQGYGMRGVAKLSRGATVAEIVGTARLLAG